jgi:mannan endo-1,4-beta-mannosidase
MSLAAAKRQSNSGAPAFNGVFGVDSQDILNAPHIDFGTFQLFPDQNNYGVTGVDSPAPSADFNDMLSQTTNFINSQVDTGQR